MDTGLSAMDTGLSGTGANLSGFDIAREMSYPTPFQSSPLLPLLLLSLASQKHTPDTKSCFRDVYDYIIVGAGSAGCVVASRLSEKKCVTVLLLEAGKSSPLLTDVLSISRSYFNTDIDWQYRTVPQKHTGRILKNRQVLWPSGKTIGGTSIFNGMLYIRGSHQNYDDWEADGAEGWSWKDVFPYFKKAEDNRDPDIVRNGFHGVGGPNTVERFKTESEFLIPYLEAGKNLGYPYVDPNGASQIGISDYQGNIRGGQRCSCAKAYLVPAENRTNLDIVAEAFVTKVLIKRKRAYGVRFDYKGCRYVVKARKEVILSAGAVNSAQLLMLSGIGPKHVLRKFNIPVIADLPVGANFQDHCGAFTYFSANSSIPTFVERLQDPQNIVKYIESRSGTHASNGIIGMSFLKNKPPALPWNVPDYQLYIIEAASPLAKTEWGLTESAYNQFYAPYENGTNVWCLSQVVHPRSCGHVSIRSSCPYDEPVIDPNYLADPRDLRDIVSGMKTCLRIFRSPEMKALGVKPFETLIPGCEEFADNENKYLECCARSKVVTASHQVGTAKMGNPADNNTVVDPELRVIGIRRLRVVDASVIPIVPTGNTNNPVIMVAEKASDLIKKQMLCARPCQNLCRH